MDCKITVRVVCWMHSKSQKMPGHVGNAAFELFCGGCAATRPVRAMIAIRVSRVAVRAVSIVVDSNLRPFGGLCCVSLEKSEPNRDHYLALLPFLLKFALILWPLFAFDFPGAVFGCVFLCATNKAWDAQKTGQNWLLRFGFCVKQTPKTRGGVLGPKAPVLLVPVPFFSEVL